jgi:BirA family transcriptional regulator, biotin operon repressor / biotin---[acetyl-CoA-carboxylase] ligase
MRRFDAGAIPGVEVRVVARCRSTNSALLADPSPRRVLLVAERQTAGRGRRGRRWLSARGAALTFSIAAPMARPLREIAPLAPVAGVAIARALRRLGVRRVGLKWPNDLMVNGAKLGGILVETRSRDGSIRVVVGVGINLKRTPLLRARLKRRIAFVGDYTRADGATVLRRCALALVDALARFEQRGFAPFAREWTQFDSPKSGRAHAEALA